MFDDGLKVRDYIHQEEVAAACKAVISGAYHGVFNTGLGIGFIQVNSSR